MKIEENRVRCIDCMRIENFTEEEEKINVHEYAMCHGEGGSKSADDILAYRICSRFVEGENDIELEETADCRRKVKCLECENLVKMNYIDARPTHHENWQCPKKGVTKQYEDCEAPRCCNSYKYGVFKNKSTGKY